MIALSEWFVSVQGEGLRTGEASVFIRTGGCPVACSWCDTTGWGGEGDWKVSKGVEVETLVEEICAMTPTRWAVITGGEPVAQKDLPKLIAELHRRNFNVAIETSGSLRYEPVWNYVHWNDGGDRNLDFNELPDHITVSPKDSIVPSYPALEEWFRVATEFKVVVDRKWEEHPALMRVLTWRKDMSRFDVPLYVQPEWNDMQRWTKECLWLIEYNPTVRLSLQTHKWIGVR